MQVRSAVFVTSAADSSGFLKRPIPHFVFAGRSNVGKSSLLNSLLNRKKLAKTSQTPGKTRLVNYFLINDQFFFVDIPGYGYAKVSKQEQEKWGSLIEDYLTETPFIGVIFLLLDIRHDPSVHDRQMIDWLRATGFPFRIILTKADKLSRNKGLQQQRNLAKQLGMSNTDLIVTSSQNGNGMRDVWTFLNQAFEETKSRINQQKDAS
ncbi:ribosome biogenesis GTP-binding protein YihA/YsxC [Acanthopleuribacter pedis]|uniref:Probable GTP-binding protein EngB n=1 Tax=Acanthopleuribacter pedis TaxID=442870 RepID=A0A8J7QC38_9BACT|nr:ribosome biogenesis GTP-binding protein YihA/YsxC [Acanthopleuribacter pedis]MBO1318266.1 YihA family ribosome biogenesis GTP-binding protein [Acanthopleuribacter pedis]